MDVPPFARKPNVVRDCSSRLGAHELAARIRSAWAKLGLDVKTEVIEMPGTKKDDGFFVVRSDMAGGLPGMMAKKRGSEQRS